MTAYRLVSTVHTVVKIHILFCKLLERERRSFSPINCSPLTPKCIIYYLPTGNYITLTLNCT